MYLIFLFLKMFHSISKELFDDV